ncbi:MAG: hypothetical protein LBN01_04060 [Endomicrobium sp.]|jgi:chromosomal replication initiation ATPase DnaA|nr:hypothetical protein [Endomicrobium sp.]
MWSEISTELKGKIPDEWLEPVKEESYVSNKLGQVLVLAVPNDYYLKRFKTEYKSQIQEVIKLKFNENIEVQFQIVSAVLTAEENLIEKPKAKTLLMEKNSFNGSPLF